ncbi:MAG: hypothetical protein O2816_15650 [Planctomycetota bacterium]|nr:hypothetical protein [Planctomycetota bacterium]
MNVHDALDHIDVIHAQLSRSNPVRGYRAATVAWSAGLGVAGALVQAAWVGEALAERQAYLGLWVGLALLGVLALTLEVGRRYHLSCSRQERFGLLHTLFALLPAFGAAGVLTLALGGRSDEVFSLLPGLWMLCFSLGIFASLPRLPEGVGAIGCWYFASAAWVLAQAPGAALSPWTMGVVFGVGQLWSAVLLARHPEGAEFPLDPRETRA